LLVLVTGATGFLGRQVVPELLARRHQVRCLIHSPGKERLFDHGEVEVHYGSILNPESLSQAMYGVQSVAHLVGIIRSGRGASFDLVHRQGTANVVEAAKDAGAREIIYVSAMGAAPDPKYPYLHSKQQGELRVTSSGLDYTILRPSVIFGEGDEFMTALAGLVRAGPVTPVIGSGKNRMQPVAVKDVARCVAASVGNSLVKGKTINLGGPHRLSYNDLLEEVALAMGRPLRRVHIPTALVWPAVSVAQQLLPRPPVTTTQLRMLGVRNVAEGRDMELAFGFTPTPLRGNIDYVNAVSFGDALRMTLGLSMPRRD
jgi:NADH dehydrogenase